MRTRAGDPPTPGLPAPDIDQAFSVERQTLDDVFPRAQLSIVLPVFNEEANIDRAVRHAIAGANALGLRHEVIAVDDGSRDRTAEILRRLETELTPTVRVLRHDVNRGYGAALRTGFDHAVGDLVFYTDADNQFDPVELARVVPLMSDSDAVFGYRQGRRDPFHRRLVSKAYNRLARATLGIAVRDVNCSFKMFRGEVLRGLHLVSDDFLIDTEIVAQIQRGNWRCTEIGVTHFDRAGGESSVRPRHVIETFASLLRARRTLASPSSRPAELDT